VLAVLAAFFLWQCWSAVSRWSITSDEIVHIPAGYLYWKLGDHSINPEHPPLAKLLATAPLLLTRPKLPKLDGYRGNAQYRFCHIDNPTRSILLPTRLVVVALSLLGVLVTFLWSRRLLGAGAALVAATLYVLEPNMTAHSSVVTTDVPFTVTFIATVAALWWCVERLTWTRVVVFGLALGAAVTTKYSAVFLVPIVTILAAAAAFLRPEMPQYLWRNRGADSGAPPAPRSLRSRLAAMAVALAVAGAISYAAIWAVYGFSFRPGGRADSDNVLPASETIARLQEKGVAIARQPYVYFDEHRLLPHPYIVGLLDVARHNTEGHAAYLLGERSMKGWRQYFMVTFLVKTPLPLLLLFVLGSALLLRSRLLDPLALAFLVVPIVVHFGAAIMSSINIGHRHLLPIVPFVIILAAAAVPALGTLGDRWRRRFGQAVALLLVWSCFEAVRYRPHFLAYFNQLAGGPENGYTVLGDSNLDWGQDLYLLKQWVDENQVKDLRVSYFGPSWPDVDAGIPCVYVTSPSFHVRDTRTVRLQQGDLFAISATLMQGIGVEPEGVFDFLKRYRPVARLGYSIFIFELDDRYLITP
jgi:hypothetical protein